MRNRIKLLAASSVAALALAACGSADGSEDSTDSGGASGDPIKIVTINPLTRAASVNPEIGDAAQAAVEAINEAGGVNGRPLELTVCDDQGDPNLAASCARDAVADGAVAHVSMLDNLGPSYIPILQQAGIASIGGYPVTGPDLTAETVFPLAGGIAVTLTGAGNEIAHLELEKVSFLYQNFQGAQAYIDYLSKGLAQNDLEINKNVPVDATAPDMSPFASSAIADGTDAIVIVTGGDAAVNLVKSIHDLGYDGTIILVGGAATSEDALAKMGPAAERNVYSLSPCVPPLAEGNETLDQFKEEVTGYKSDANLNYNSELAWASVYLFAHVAEDLDTIDRESVLEAMSSLGDYDSGICGSVNYSEPVTEFPGITRVFNPNMMYTEISDGKVLPLTGEFVNVFES
jgi:branched-chain amino acid transport system substrate-binding protein